MRKLNKNNNQYQKELLSHARHFQFHICLHTVLRIQSAKKAKQKYNMLEKSKNKLKIC